MRKPGRRFEVLEVQHLGEVDTLEIRVQKTDGGNIVYYAENVAKDIRVSGSDYKKCVEEGTQKLKAKMGATIREKIFVRFSTGTPSHHYGDPGARYREEAGAALTVYRFQESVAPDGEVIATKVDGAAGWERAEKYSENNDPNSNDNRRSYTEYSTVVLDFSEGVYSRLKAFVAALEALGEAINREMYPDKLIAALKRFESKFTALAAPADEEE